MRRHSHHEIGFRGRQEKKDSDERQFVKAETRNQGKCAKSIAEFKPVLKRVNIDKTIQKSNW